MQQLVHFDGSTIDRMKCTWQKSYVDPAIKNGPVSGIISMGIHRFDWIRAATPVGLIALDSGVTSNILTPPFVKHIHLSLGAFS